MLVLNTNAYALPTPIKWDQALKYEFAKLSARAKRPIMHPESLNADESARYDLLQRQVRAEESPRWNNYEFPFAAYGKPGCLRTLPPTIARFLVDRWPGLLIVGNEEIKARIAAKEIPADLKVTPPGQNIQTFQPDVVDGMWTKTDGDQGVTDMGWPGVSA